MHLAILLFLGVISESISDIDEFFNSKLSIDGPSGTLFSGDKAQFICTAKTFDGKGELIWHWHFKNRSSFYADVLVEPENDVLESNYDGIVRKSVISVPDYKNIGYIGCTLSTKKDDHSYEKFVPVKILGMPRQNQRRYSEVIYPQVVLELYGPILRKPLELVVDWKEEEKSYQHAPYLVTNQTIDLSSDIKSVKLSCFLPPSHKDKYEWVISSDTNKKMKSSKPSVSFVLGQLALIYREAILAGRLPPSSSVKCDNNSDTTSDAARLVQGIAGLEIKAEILQVIMPPIVEMEQVLTYSCQPKKNFSDLNSSFVTITNLATRTGMGVEGRDQEFLNLVNILMQILQASNETGGGGTGGSSGPLVGLGFGSSSIMLLMGLTIFYLKRQLTQLQDQIKENEHLKKLKKKSRSEYDTDDDTGL